MNALSGILQALFMLLGFVLWLIPLAITVWVLVKLADMSRDLDVVRRQLAVMADQTGAQVISPPAKSRRVPAPLWAFAVVFAVFVLVIGGLYAVGMSSSSQRLDATSDSAEVVVPERVEELPPAPMATPAP